jgi:hypothetical protein
MLRKSAWAAVLAASLSSQPIIPASAGLVSYADEAYIDDRLVEISPTRFFVVNDNAVLRTGAGRAEVLLGPCAAMWIDENSSFRMISTASSDIRIEVLTGSVIVAAGAMVKGTRLTVLLKTSVAPVDRKGAYRFDAEPPRVQVLAGQTTVQWAKRGISVTAGRWLPLDAPGHGRKFDNRNPDALDTWSNGRAAFLARLSGQRTGNAQEPAPSADMDAVRIATMGRAKELPNMSTQVNTGLPPAPDSSRSGCGGEAWRVRTQ